MIARALAVLSLAAAAARVDAQTSDSTGRVPDRDWNAVEGRWGSARLAFALLYDVTTFTQDAESQTQVGTLATTGRFRTDRLIVSGALGRSRRLTYLAAVDFNGLEHSGEAALSVNDLALTIPLGTFADLAIGKQKEGVTQQMLASSRGLPFTERPAPITAFFPTRSKGIRLNGVVPHRHAGWSLGAFSDALFESSPSGVNQVTARVFDAPLLSADSSRIAQVALNGRWTDDRRGKLRFRAKPEVNEAPDFVDTGEIPASGAVTADLETVLQRGAVSFVAEVLGTHVFDGTGPAARLFSYSAELSWRPGGESRAYEPAMGVLGRVRLGHRTAWELATRFSHTDLTDHAVDGGMLNQPSVAVGWYGPQNLRAELDYAYAVLNRGGGVGRTQLLTMRLQWELR
jgi:phosphate-selective porin